MLAASQPAVRMIPIYPNLLSSVIINHASPIHHQSSFIISSTIIHHPIHHPSSIIHHPSFIIRYLSTVVPSISPSTIIHNPSSNIHPSYIPHPSFIIHYLPSIIHFLSSDSFAEHKTSLIHMNHRDPPSIVYHPIVLSYFNPQRESKFSTIAFQPPTRGRRVSREEK